MIKTKFLKLFSKNIDKKYFYQTLFRKSSSEDIKVVPYQNHIIENKLPVKLISFYLPQFHIIPENDKWWGPGFTEWNNVIRGLPQFKGHDQPILPRDLGFYSLRDPEIPKRQIEIAKNYGIYGFCYHYYWFSGRRILNYPIDHFLKNKNLDFKFCLNWANENWTRRWDGRDSEVLLKQEYKEEDPLDFIKDISIFLKDSRYIKVDNKPLLMVYNPEIIPNIKKVVLIWREYCRNNGIGEIYLVLSHSIKLTNPIDIGFDAAAEFPPNNFMVPKVNDGLILYNKNYKGSVYDYKDLLKEAENFESPDYVKFRGICPSWDNEARRPGAGRTFVNASPEIYKKWLKNICDYTVRLFKEEEQLVFINAWNEWAEGAILEPTKKMGYSYLQKTYEVLKELNKNKRNIQMQPPEPYFKCPGFCPCCCKNVIFESKDSWFRDNLKCDNCGSIPRERALMLVIEKYFPNWKYLKIHESSPVDRGASKRIKKECLGYTGSQFYPGKEPGVECDGFINEDLENQTFSDSSFDIVITQDVFEHLYDPERAFAEIKRTLKKNGAHIFTVPLINKTKKTEVWATKDNKGNNVFLAEPEYHGNPVSPLGSPVTMHWGFDIVDYIKEKTGMDTKIEVIDDLNYGIRAEFIEVLVSKKE